MSINVTCHFGGRILNNVGTKPGNQPVRLVVTAALQRLFGVDEANQKLLDVVAVMVDYNIYGINGEVNLNDGDAIILLLKAPVTTPIPPGDESITSRVSEIRPLSEGIEESTKEVEAVRLLRRLAVPILRKDLKDLKRRFLFPDLLLDNLFEVDEQALMSSGYHKVLKELLRKGGKLVVKMQKFFRIPRGEFLWHAHLFMPMLTKFSLHGLLSDESKLGMSHVNLSRQSGTRKLYYSGIFPDLCDGWLLKVAQRKNGDNVDYTLQTPFGETAYLSELPWLDGECGDANILLLDFFVEIKPDRSPGNADRAKLHLQMGQAARLFADRISQYPLVFGLTCDANIINGYAAQIRERGTSAYSKFKELVKDSPGSPTRLRSQGSVDRPKEKKSEHKQFFESVQAAENNPDAPRSSRSKSSGSGSASSSGRARSKSSQPKDKKEEAINLAPPVAIDHLWTLNLNDPTHSVLFAGYLTRIREMRLQQLKKWCDGLEATLFKKLKEPEQLENVSSDAASDFDDSSSRKSSEPDGSNGDKHDGNVPTRKLVAFLSNYGFMPRDNTNLGRAGDTFVYRGYLLMSGLPAVIKGYIEFEDLCRETQVYEHLEQQGYKHMPRLLKTHCKDDAFALITEDLGDEPLKLESKQDVKLFAMDLLMAVNSLHKKRVIHGDLKTSNLRYFKDNRLVKLFDFAYSAIVKYSHLSAKCFGFTHGYASPEVLDTDRVTTADDMFSVGMILASIVYKFKPSNDDDYKQVLLRIEEKELTPLCNGSMLDLIGQLLMSANVRLSAEQALRAPVFTEASESLSSGDDEMCLD